MAAPFEEASDLLDYYLKQLVPLQAKAFSITNEQPDQLNNEVRNCLTHLARAFAEKEDSKSMRQEMARARGHLERAARDCLKLSIAEIGKRINAIYYHILHTTPRPPTEQFLEQMRELEKERQNLMQAEGEGEPVVERYTKLLKKMEEFWSHHLTRLNI